MDGVRTGRLDPKKVEHLLTANVDMDLGSGYGVNLGYNEFMGDIKQDLKLSITKKF